MVCLLMPYFTAAWEGCEAAKEGLISVINLNKAEVTELIFIGH